MGDEWGGTLEVSFDAAASGPKLEWSPYPDEAGAASWRLLLVFRDGFGASQRLSVRPEDLEELEVRIRQFRLAGKRGENVLPRGGAA